MTKDRAKFKQMLRNILKRQSKRREARRMKKLNPKKTPLKIQLRLLILAIAIVLFLALSGCSGNYRIGDTSKVYCAAVETPNPAEKSKVTKDETTVEQ